MAGFWLLGQASKSLVVYVTLSFAVSHLAQYASNPLSQHMQLAEYSDQQNCPNVWYLSMVLKITYELPQMETNCQCMKGIH